MISSHSSVETLMVFELFLASIIFNRKLRIEEEYNQSQTMLLLLLAIHLTLVLTQTNSVNMRWAERMVDALCLSRLLFAHTHTHIHAYTRKNRKQSTTSSRTRSVYQAVSLSILQYFFIRSVVFYSCNRAHKLTRNH
jgi:hypothetical protein